MVYPSEGKHTKGRLEKPTILIPNFWIRTNDISAIARKEATEKVTQCIRCVHYSKFREFPERSLWKRTPEGLLQFPDNGSPSTPKSNGGAKTEPSQASITANDFLLFAAIDYHVFRKWEVQVQSAGETLFSTKDMPPSTIIDVDSVEATIPVVAAQMVHRPHSQSQLRGIATQTADEKFILDLFWTSIKWTRKQRHARSISIPMHPDHAKISASLTELARAYYYPVVQHIKGTTSPDISDLDLARINVGQTL